MRNQYLIYKIWWLLYLLPLFGYTQTRDSEHIHAHFSHSIAIAGEIVWLKCYSMTTEGPAASKIAYAELVNRDGEAVQQVMFDMENGQGFSHLEIPSHLPSDHYLIRCYTRISPLMGEKGVFNQFITIINPKAPPAYQVPNQSKPVAFTPPQHTPVPFTPNRAKSNSAIQLNLPALEKQDDALLSISLKNPFLPSHLEGYVHGQIYESPQNFPLIPELFGHIVYGKINEPVNQQETYYLSAHGKQSVLYSDRANAQGELFFELGPMKEYNYFIVQSADFEKQLDFQVISPFIKLKFKSGFDFPPLLLNQSDKPFLEELLTAGRTATYFTEIKADSRLPIVTGFIADKTYLLDDYTRFESVEVTLREYVPDVLVRKRGKKTVFKLLNNPLGSVFDNNPLLLIDAMPVFDSDQLAAFDPKKIKMLEVLSREFSFNLDKFEGVLSFSTFDNDFGGYEIPANALYLNYPSFQPNLIPEIGRISSMPHYPNFRNVLAWQHLSIDQSISFSTAETSGLYEIRLSQLSTGNGFQQYKHEFEVTK
mgnify:CR=1 FL=1